MSDLFGTAVYANASPARLRAASKGTQPSVPIVEKKRWTTAAKLLDEAHHGGQNLPIVFSHYAALTFWAILSDIRVLAGTTEYSFRNLKPLRGYQRRDLVVQSTGATLSNDFIRSYALVRTPEFLMEGSRRRRKVQGKTLIT